MAADASIYANLLARPKSMQEYQAEYAAQDDARQNRQLNALRLQGIEADMGEKVRTRQEGEALRNALAGGLDISTPEGQQKLYGIAPMAAGGIIKGRAETLKEMELANKAKADTAKTQGETADQALKRYRSALDFIDTPQGAARWLQTQYQDPTLAQHMQALGPIEQAVQRIPQTPQEFQAWRQQAAMGMEKYSAKLQDDQRIAETGRHNRSTEDLTKRGQDVSASTTMRGQNMVDARSREANSLTKEANATVYDPERGVLINKATGLARPAATFDGKPLGAKDKPLPEGAQKQLVGTRNLQDAVGGYLEKLKTFGTTDIVRPDARAEMGNAYNNMMLQAKEAYNLGVLNGPDYQILQNVVRDPTSMAGAITSKDAMAKQAQELSRIARSIEGRVLEAHGKPAPNTPPPGKTVKRTGTDKTGRKVVEYTDGSIGYAD
jgi:hypothetical protein